jgi:hypothetical protein
MHLSMQNLPVVLETPGATLRAKTWEGMTVVYAQLAKGTDLTPAFKGLRHDMCESPHWGIVLKGVLHLRYADGQEESIRAGEVWHAPAGHTAWCDEDTDFLDISPPEDFQRVLTHVRKVVGA